MGSLKTVNKFISKRTASDFVYTFAALLIVNVVMQLIIYPLINKFYSADKLGNVVYYSGIIYTISASIGGAISNQKLLLRTKYEKNNSDFNIIVISVSAVIFVGLSLLSVFLGNTVLSSALYGLAGGLVFLRYYAEVEFRLTKNFKGYLYYYLLVSFGYLIGFGLFLLTEQWCLIFVIGESIAILYVLIKGSIFKKEPLTGEIQVIIKLVLVLTFSYLLGSLGAHYYKVFLKLFFNGDAVTVYYVSSFFGKSLDLVITPITTLMLSYLTTGENKRIGVSTRKIILFSLLASAVLYICLVVATPIYCYFLYPNIYDEVMSISFIVNIAQSVSVISSVLIVLVLIKQGSKTHLLIQFLSVLIYIIFTSLFTYLFGLIGFGIGAIIGFSCKLLMIIFLGIIGEIKRV